LNLARVAALPDFARDEVIDMIDMRVMEDRVYWEAAFQLDGLHRDEIEWVEALGPGLIKPAKKWMTVFRENLSEIGAEGGDDDACLNLGPFSMCMNMPKMIRSLARNQHPREESRVRVTRSLWYAGDSSGVIVSGRLLEYSMVTFRVRTNGKGDFPSGVRYLQPFDMAGTRGWIRPQNDAPANPTNDRIWSPHTRTGIPRQHRRIGWGPLLPHGWEPRAARPLPPFPNPSRPDPLREPVK
jgi:hypothetical protein